jgi:hypothetical protein
VRYSHVYITNHTSNRCTTECGGRIAISSRWGERFELWRELPSSQLKVARAHPSFGFATNRSLGELENPLHSSNSETRLCPATVRD